MIERIVTLASEYVATIGALAHTEAALDAQRLRRTLRARLIGVAALVLGVVWLNVAVLLWLLTTPRPLAGAALIAVVAIAAGLLLSARARRDAEPFQMFEETRRVLAAELGVPEGGPAVREGLGAREGVSVRAPALPVTAEEAGARLRSIREAVREAVREASALALGPDVDADDESVGVRFEPRSRTMRAAVWLWRMLPRVPAGAALASAVGMLAVGNPRLRRLAAVIALLRNLGGRPRPPGAGRHDGYAGPRTPYPL